MRELLIMGEVAEKWQGKFTLKTSSVDIVSHSSTIIEAKFLQQGKFWMDMFM